MSDLAGRRYYQVRWDVENTDGLDRWDHLVADASVGPGAVRLDDRRKASDHDCRWASVRDFLLGADLDYHWAAGVVAECRAAREPPRQDGQLPADQAFAGRGVANAGWEIHPECFVRWAAAADREERAARAEGQTGPESEALRERLALQQQAPQAVSQQEPTELERPAKLGAAVLEQPREPKQKVRGRAVRMLKQGELPVLQ